MPHWWCALHVSGAHYMMPTPDKSSTSVQIIDLSCPLIVLNVAPCSKHWCCGQNNFNKKYNIFGWQREVHSRSLLLRLPWIIILLF